MSLGQTNRVLFLDFNTVVYGSSSVIRPIYHKMVVVQQLAGFSTCCVVLGNDYDETNRNVVVCQSAPCVDGTGHKKTASILKVVVSIQMCRLLTRKYIDFQDTYHFIFITCTHVRNDEIS